MTDPGSLARAMHTPSEHPLVPGAPMAPGLLAKAMGVIPFPEDAGAFERLQKALFEGDQLPSVFLVLHEDQITPYAYLNEERALEAARSLQGVVACVPIVYDFRTQS